MQYCSIEVYITRFCWAMSPRARVAASYPTFNQHTFLPCEIWHLELEPLFLKLGQQAKVSAECYFPSAAEKMAHGWTQCVTGGRKNLFPRMLAVKNAVPGRNMLFTRIFLPHLGIRWFHNILSFESGAMVKVLGLDDSEWKDVLYYSYDLVHDGNRK